MVIAVRAHCNPLDIYIYIYIYIYTHIHMNNPVTSVYSTNLFHGTVGLLLAQSSGILLILHYRFQQVHTCNIKQIQFTIKVQRAAVCRLQDMSVLM